MSLSDLVMEDGYTCPRCRGNLSYKETNGIVVIKCDNCGWKKEVKKKMPYKFEVFQDRKDEFRFRMVAPNGQIIATSEGYTQKQSCLDTIDSIQKYAGGAQIVEVEK